MHAMNDIDINPSNAEATFIQSTRNQRFCLKCLNPVVLVFIGQLSFMGMDAWMIVQLNGALIRKLRGSLMCLACIDMLSMSVFTIRHWQSIGRLVQELDACTVHVRSFDQGTIGTTLHHNKLIAKRATSRADTLPKATHTNYV